MWRLSISKALSKALVLSALGALLYTCAAPAGASTFAVDPVSVSLNKGNASTIIAVTNQSQQKLRLQVTGFAWQQKPSGEMQLTPSDDLVFFPSLLVLDPGEMRRIRVGVATTQGGVEKTFRIFMEELPSLESVVTPKSAQVVMRMKVGIPVFVAPATAPVLAGSVRNAVIRDGALSFDVVNGGNTHFAIQTVNVVGKNVAGGPAFTRDLSGWYVLAGGTRRFSVPIGREQCEDLRALSVRVHAGELTFGDSFSDVSKQCGPVSRP